MAGKWRAYASFALKPQNTFTVRSVACDTGSEISPPGGDTAPMAVTAPSRPSLPSVTTEPALS